MSDNNARSQLVSEVTHLIIECLNLYHLNPDEISEETSLFDEGLELDSIDVLEIVVGIEEKYNVKVQSSEEGKKIFQKIGTIVDFIESNKP